MKNHSFIYNRDKDTWRLAPVYDVTYALNPLINFKKSIRALSVNNKRTEIELNDVLKLADDFTIKNPKGIINEVQSMIPNLIDLMKDHAVPLVVIEGIEKKLVKLI